MPKWEAGPSPGGSNHRIAVSFLGKKNFHKIGDDREFREVAGRLEGPHGRALIGVEGGAWCGVEILS